MTQERFFELVYAWKDGDLTGDELYKRVFILSNVVGQSEQYHCELYDFGRRDKPCDKQCDGCKATNLELHITPINIKER